MTEARQAPPGKRPAKSKSTSGRSRAKSKAPRPTLGWKEWVSFPGLGIEGIRSKVDTGARTSALHATDLEEEVDDDGIAVVRFKVLCERRPRRKPVTVSLPVIDKRFVRDSSGREELRPVVLAEIEVCGQRWKIEITLTRRDDMEFNMLLGRRGIRRRFLVDPGRVYLGGDPPPSEGRERGSPEDGS
ncbi:MAG: RimK/LysX family protein [Gemmatimonadota bacterium]|nr:RimK/LysX family protein [Gemmatimonadota bacterium]